MNQTVVGYFDSRAQAQEAVTQLKASGFSARISDEAPYDVTTTTGTSSSTRAAGDADTGMLSGIRNFFSDVFGDSHEHLDAYEEGVKRGGCVVKVSVAGDEQLAQASSILEDAGAADIDERASEWRQPAVASSAATTGTTTSAASTAYAEPAGSIASELSASQSAAIPIVEESLEVGKRTVDRGGVRVYTRTVETPVNEAVSLREEHAVVQRRPVDRALTAAELDGFQERTIEVRETAEKAVVSKSARVVEEVVVGKQASEHTETISDSVRHTEVEVERLDGGTAGTTGMSGTTGTLGSSAASDAIGSGLGIGSQSLDTPATMASGYSDRADYGDAYRSDYDTRYASLGGSYDDYEPAYRYGHSVANDQSYSGREWDDVEPTLKSDWSTKNPDSPWEKVKDGVKHAWHVAKG